jgi:hypothetical protein
MASCEMSEQFQHVMVLASIIIGLGITQLLGGIGAAIERISGQGSALKIRWTFSLWALFMFVWLVAFWWWQFRLLEMVTTWTLGRYLFLLCYAVLLFLLVIILMPRQWDEVSDLDEYFLAKRKWFFWTFALANAADVVDSYIKGGWDYFLGTGPVALGLVVATVPAVVIGIRSTNMRVQTGLALTMVVWQMVASFDVFGYITL